MIPLLASLVHSSICSSSSRFFIKLLRSVNERLFLSHRSVHILPFYINASFSYS
jgi:hypothetical protein